MTVFIYRFNPSFPFFHYLKLCTVFNTEINTYWTYFSERDGDDESGGIIAMPDYVISNINAVQPVL